MGTFNDDNSMNANHSRRFLLCLVLFTLACVSTASAFYNPTTGRWLTRDHFGEDGGENLYSYVDNAASDHYDPVGLAPAPRPPQNQLWLGVEIVRFPTLNTPPCDGPGYCGEVTFEIRWRLQGRTFDLRPGYVIQAITISGTKTKCNATKANLVCGSGARIPVTYWEAWGFARNADLSADGTDTFSWPDEMDSEGNLTFEATAAFYPVDNLATGFVRNNPMTCAGSLLSTRTEPTGITTATATVKHSLKTEWDCCECNRYTRKRTKIIDFAPRRTTVGQ